MKMLEINIGLEAWMPSILLSGGSIRTSKRKKSLIIAEIKQFRKKKS